MNVPEPTAACESGFLGFLNCNSGAAQSREGQTVGTLVASLAVSFGSLGVQALVFILLRLRLSRIYRPRSYLVPERERVPPPPGGAIGWLYPLFTTSNLALIQKCGLDAYFFLRFLRMLLKIFLPASLLIIPILLPINHTAGGDSIGLDRYSITNIADGGGDRLWAHCILAIVFIFWVFYVVFKELRGYIRVRQAFLTSPQHRIRASATTVLVTGIPRKWLTMEALSGLYDVFPGGIRNIWINRNFDDLADKVSYRDNIAKNLEDAETVLVKLCRKKHLEAEKKRAKEEGRKSKTKQEKKQDKIDEDAAAERLAQGHGVSAGERHDLSQGMQDVLEEEEMQQKSFAKRSRNPFGAGHGAGFVADDALYRINTPTHANDPNGVHPSSGDSEGRLGSLHQQTSETQPRSPTSDTRPPQTRHPLMASPLVGHEDSPGSDETLGMSASRTPRPSGETKPKSSMQIEEPPSHKAARRPWNIFQNNDNSLVMPSPLPHVAEDDDEFPLHHNTEKQPNQETTKQNKPWTQKLAFWKDNDEEAEKPKYSSAIDKKWDEDQDEEPCWRQYIEAKDRETMRLPLFSPTWFPSIPLVGKKVDRIYHLRRELARLNLEIEDDQNNVERFPFMNSAFIQFNHQIAAHMCCQSLSHHIPQHMAPRTVEISPDDVIWDNMSIKWWERYLRTGLVLLICAALIILYAVPVALTSALNNVSRLAAVAPFLSFVQDAPSWVISIVQGVLPPVLLSLILLLVPIIFRLLIKQQGVPTGSDKELGVQTWYFAFLFIQVFLIVTLTSGITSLIQSLATNPGSIVTSISESLPTASNYFFSYLTVQALSNSASALLQAGSLFMWFIMAPLLDSTARAKWKRQTELNQVQWGTFFPPFTNFATIGIIYSIISPFILVFMIFIFGLFWIVYRYNVIYVYKFRHDTGGLLFPVAVNQLFTGLYFLELCLIGLFFTITDSEGRICFPQAIIMIVMLVFTVMFQWLMNLSFKPLFQYLPITLEDEAVIRDEQFAKAQASKFAPLNHSSEDERDIQDVLEDREQMEKNADHAAEDAEKQTIERRRSQTPGSPPLPDLHPVEASRSNQSPANETPAWHKKSDSKPAWGTDKWKRAGPEAVARLRYLADGKPVHKKDEKDPEAQHTVGDVLFSGFADELEDLTPEERDLLVRYAFQHSALRARRPVVWIPRDTLGVSDDEIKRAKKMSTVTIEGQEKTLIWMSNEGTALDGKGRVVFRRSPPDFSNVDLIAL